MHKIINLVCCLSLLFTSDVLAAKKQDIVQLKEKQVGSATKAMAVDDLEQRIKIHGFISVGAAVSDVNAVYNTLLMKMVTPEIFAIGDQPAFDPYTAAGVQFEVKMTDTVSFITQFVARGIQTYDVKANWAYLRYRPDEHFNLQIGRIRAPVFLISDTLDVGYTYPWIRPPAEIYGQILIPNITGVQAIFDVHVKDIEVKFHPYWGSSVMNSDDTPALSFDLKIENIVGAELSIGNSALTVRSSFIAVNISAPTTPLVLTTTPMTLILPKVDHEEAFMWGAGLILDWNNIIGYAEYSQRWINGYMPDTAAWYGLLGFRIKKFTPYGSYARVIVTDKGARAVTGNTTNDALLTSMLDTEQETIEGGLRIDLIENLALKMSYQRIIPHGSGRGLFTAAPGKNVNVFNVAVQAIV